MEPQETQRVVIRRTRPTYSKEHKVGFIFVAGIGGLAFLLGTSYLFDHLGSPFDIAYVGPEFLTTSQKNAAEIAEQKVTDTDGDGLTDYDELYVHKTSPYLADTDGDGYTDETEVRIGTDPNCKGNECMEVVEEESDLFSDLVDTTATEETVDSSVDLSDAEASMDVFENFTVDQVRELLLTAGVDQASIDALSDEQVMTLYQSVLAEMETSEDGTVTTTESDQTNSQDLEP
ncbi:MAG: hypothetical protein WC730_01575 [Patescibacteria group bacterium]|jgi:hypothetical protein